MLIYRLECGRCKRGPYSCGCRCPEDGGYGHIWEHSVMNGRPGPIDDIPEFGEMAYKRHLLFGCPTAADLAWWFDPIEPLLKAGFVIKTYHADDVLVGCGKKQVVFDSKTACAVEGISFDTLIARIRGEHVRRQC